MSRKIGTVIPKNSSFTSLQKNDKCRFLTVTILNCTVRFFIPSTLDFFRIMATIYLIIVIIYIYNSNYNFNI